MTSEPTIEDLLSLLEKCEVPDEALETAGRTLAFRGSRSATKRLIRLLRTCERRSARWAAVFALRWLQDKRSLELLNRIAVDDAESIDVRQEAMEALIGLHRYRPRTVMLALRRCAGDQSNLVRWTAAFAIAECDPQGGSDILRKLAEDDCEHVRRQSRDALDLADNDQLD